MKNSRNLRKKKNDSYRMAVCDLVHNPAYPTTMPYGTFWMYEFGYWSPLYIDGYVNSLPHPLDGHGFSINTSAPDNVDCESTEPHYNPWGMMHGDMNMWPSHAGDLDPLVADATGYSAWSDYSWMPSLYGSNAIPNRSMCVYEHTIASSLGT